MNWEIFENNIAEIKIPEKGHDSNLKNHFESLTEVISKIDKKLKSRIVKN